MIASVPAAITVLHRLLAITYYAVRRCDKAEEEPVFSLLNFYLMLDISSGSKIVHVILVNG